MFPARHGPAESVTVAKIMAGEVPRDVHHHQEHNDAGGEEDLESSGEAVAGCLVVRMGHCLSPTVCGSTAERRRIHEYLSFRAAVKTDAGTAAAAHTDESKVRFARHPTGMHRSAAIIREEWWPSDRQTSYAYTGQRAPRGPRLQLGSRISAGVVIPGVFPQLSGLLPWGRCFRSCDCVTLCETWPGQILRRNSLKRRIWICP